MSLAKRMGDLHEAHLAEVFGGRQARSSGNQPHDQMDGRHNRYDEIVAFAWDGKSTRTGTISVTAAMLQKAAEQAHGERPMLSLRWYGDDRLRTCEDWHLIREDDLLELLDLAREVVRLRQAVGKHDCLALYQHGDPTPWTCPRCGLVWVVRDSKFIQAGG